MSTDEGRPQRHDEIGAILERKPGVREIRDEANRYTVVGAASRHTYANWLTPIEDHFVCHRNPIPEIDAESWSVSLTGLDEDISLPVTAICEEYPTVAVAHTMECAGNGRGQHDPETSSVQWGCEAVGTSIWTGTPLRSVLRASGVGTTLEEANGRWLTAIGGDSIDEEVFARSIPLSKALEDTILAYGMNGHPLPEEHGYPVRLIVPGWYGVNNVKWLEELRVMDTMVTEGSLDRPGIHARWQQSDYRIHPGNSEPMVHETIDETDTEEQLRSGQVDHPYTFDAMVMSLIGAPEGDVELESVDASVEVLGSPGRVTTPSSGSRSLLTAGRPGTTPRSSALITQVPGGCSGTTGRRVRARIRSARARVTIADEHSPHGSVTQMDGPMPSREGRFPGTRAATPRTRTYRTRSTSRFQPRGSSPYYRSGPTTQPETEPGRPTRTIGDRRPTTGDYELVASTTNSSTAASAARTASSATVSGSGSAGAFR